MKAESIVSKTEVRRAKLHVMIDQLTQLCKDAPHPDDLRELLDDVMAFHDKTLEMQLQLEAALTGEERDQEAKHWAALSERTQIARREARARIRQMEGPLSDCSASSNDLGHHSNSKTSVRERLPELKMPALSRKGRVVATSRLSRLDPFMDEEGFLRCYVCLFTCMASRAVHLELVPQMTTARVMQALRRFIARRGRPETIQSDNFRSFKAAASELRQLWRHVDVDRVQRELVGHRIHWKFITERAPWMGGYWERLVRSIKESLRKILGKALLDEEELRTTLCEVEASLNARPLTFVGEEDHESHPLSPFQLLTGRAYVDFPAIEAHDPEWQPVERGATQWNHRWRYRQQLLARWWRSWRREYLSELMQRQKWRSSPAGPEVNDLVLILEDNIPRAQCPIGVITALHLGSDGIARSARIRTSTNVITRPVAKLVQLEPTTVSDGRKTPPSGGEDVADRNGERDQEAKHWAALSERTQIARREARARIRQMEGPLSDCSASSNDLGHHSNSKTSVRERLPELKMPVFSGEVLEFPAFWDRFQGCVHNRTDLDDASKFSYLLSSLSGEALAAVEGMPSSSANYSHAMELLQERFGRTDVIVREHVKAIWNAKPCSDSGASIQALVDEINRHLRCLTALGKNPATGEMTANEAFLPLLAEKFPEEIRLAWDVHVQSVSGTKGDLPEFLNFAQVRATAKRATAASSGGRRFVKQDDPKQQEPGPSGQEHQRTRQREKRAARGATTVLHAAVNSSCPICKGDHNIVSCEDFLHADVHTRSRMAARNKLCFRCLQGGHRAKACKVRWRCTVSGCGGSHHELLHRSQSPPRDQTPEATRSRSCMLTANGGARQVRLQSVRACAFGMDGQCVLVQCLLDPGSQSSFIRKDVADALGLTGPQEVIRLVTVDNEGGTERRMRRVEFQLGAVDPSQPRIRYPIQALVLPKICGKIRQAPVKLSEWPHLSSLPVADQCEERTFTIDVLIGLDHYFNLVGGDVRRGPAGGPVAIHSRLGWILCGQTNRRPTTAVTTLLTHVEESADQILRRFWELEAIGIATDNQTAPPDQEALQRFEQGLSFDGERYEVHLPWLPSRPSLPNNFPQARRRLLAVERRLARCEEERLEYAATMRQYVENGWAERALEIGPEGRTWYLPHHAVYQGEGKEKKCRVVFDGSARYGQTSLNRQLEVGPNLQIDLLKALLRFRRYRVGLQADIQKMYLQVRIAEQDRDACRFLWRDKSGELSHLRLQRVCFGLTCSPFLAINTVRVHARRHQDAAPRAAAEILENMYVDDLATSCDTIEEARELAGELRGLLARGGFHLHKWASNEPEALTSVPDEVRSASNRSHLWKTLGMQWDRRGDVLTFSPPATVNSPSGESKRSLLSTAFRVFDPVGCLAPFTVRAKMFLQTLWQRGTSWDEPLPHDVMEQWRRWKQELPHLSKIRLPRALVPVALGQVTRLEIHAFCDSSEKAYGAVAYMRIETTNHHSVVNFVTSKTRVAPIRRLTLPRLELMGALVAARLVRSVQKMLGLQVHGITCWCDSAVTLAWIQSSADRWKPFVRNRVAEIQQLVEPAAWRHCPGRQNPADLLSRGTTLPKLLESPLWWHGPKWLAHPHNAWPVGKPTTEDTSPVRDERRSEQRVTVGVTAHVECNSIGPERYGCVERLFRITAYCQRFVRNCRLPAVARQGGALTVAELRKAEGTWVQMAQSEAFSSELQALSRKGRVVPTSRLSRLDPFMDEEGFLRVGGRLENAELPSHMKHPVILPGDHALTMGLIRRCHARQMHAGTTHTLAILRQQYWVLKGRTQVKKVIRHCFACRRAVARPIQPRMAALPSSRVVEAAAFAHTGMDFAGPLLIRVGKRATSKCYVCLFTCMASRAVHLELVPQMTTARVMQALRRFIARRGRPETIQSDNFRSFKAAASELRQLWRHVDVDRVQRELVGHRIHWKFITERAPWMGGYWERLVRSIKESLRKILGKALLDEEELRTTLCEVEASLNARPLTFVGEEDHESHPLSPFQLLTGRAYVDFPAIEAHDPEWQPVERGATQWNHRWRYRQQLLARWWRSWRREYLSELMQRQKWRSSPAGPEVNDLVLILEDNIPRAQCPIGVITALHLGSDGIARSARIRTSTNVITRPVAKLVQLEPTTVSDGRKTPPSGGEDVADRNGVCIQRSEPECQ
ncbi:hypothetical protein T4E_10538 [Trichinella pseudospiralis]|uniref:Integrase catalytic domain-containing protein n=1 Tax=Trichinella pseudospiralis TaxID=6337 RepID=A0A0V0XF38_TRIPS|nr:hypothetical protein T4E_10538 [Trichinella pseudospiralis]